MASRDSEISRMISEVARRAGEAAVDLEKRARTDPEVAAEVARQEALRIDMRLDYMTRIAEEEGVSNRPYRRVIQVF